MGRVFAVQARHTKDPGDGCSRPGVVDNREGVALLDLTVTCSCTRVMHPEHAKGPGHYRCGCGRTVRVEAPSRLIYQPALCCYIDRHGPCKNPSEFAISLCPTHIIYVVDRVAARQGEVGEAARAAQPKLHETDEQIEQRRRGELESKHFALARALKTRVYRDSSVVYYARVSPGRIKIGVTTRLIDRMKTFRVPTSSLLAVEPGNQKVEARRHRQFTHLLLTDQQDAVGREEFREDPVLLAHINQVRTEHGDPWEIQPKLRKIAYDRICAEDHSLPLNRWKEVRNAVTHAA